MRDGHSDYKGPLIVRVLSESDAFVLAHRSYARMTDSAGSTRPWNKSSGLVSCSEVVGSKHAADGIEEILEPGVR